MRRLRIALAGMVATVFLVLVMPAAAASAHDYPVGSSPATGATVTIANPTVSVTYDAVVLNPGRGSTALQVLGPGTSTRHHETTCATVKNATVSTATALGAKGTYTVLWRVVSADGHPVTGSYTFRYAPTATAAAAAGTAAGPDCGIRQTTRGAAATGGSGTVVVVAGIAGGLVLLVVVVVVVVLRTSRGDRARSNG